ncbi:MAG: helicase C-terminal domain-containing protein [Candidatus Nitrosotenuis sp.]
MKYEQAALNAFKTIGYKPRENQVETVNRVLTQYLDEKKKIVILCAPTGTGKSVIGAAIAEALQKIVHPDIRPKASAILMHTNILTDQYFKSFNGHSDFLSIKGASNYKCPANGDPEATADVCALNDMRMALKEARGEDEENIRARLRTCETCEFNLLRRQRNSTRQLITNYSYFFIAQLFSKTLEQRTVTIWDEAHTINDVFTEHCAIVFSNQLLQKYYKEINENLRLPNIHLAQTLTDLIEAVELDEIHEGNYVDFLKILHEVYTEANKLLKAQAGSPTGIKELDKEYTKMIRLSRKYEGLACKIGDFLAFMFEHIVEIRKADKKTGEKMIVIKPIFVGDMFDILDNSEYQLFMSATINKEYMVKTFKFDERDVGFVKLAPAFPPENKKIIVYRPLSLNYTSLKQQTTIKGLQERVETIVAHHFAKGESGIIQTPSFDMSEKLAAHLIDKFKAIKIFHHEKGQKLEHMISKFKTCRTPCLLISPSLFEGIDLPDDISRFQIIAKVPYASLGDKRIAYISEKHSDIYALLALVKIVQAVGRSVRGPEDWATTYCLDTNFSKVWNLPINVWKDECIVTHRNILEHD